MENHQLMYQKDIENFALQKLLAAGASDLQAAPLAKAIAAAEIDGVSSHGLLYLPIYCLHLQCGKVNGQAIPTYHQKTQVLGLCDAATGFAHPAITLAFEYMITQAQQYGIAAVAIKQSYNCGVLGYHTEQLAQAGLVGLGFTNAPASIAPAGGKKPVIGTNPFSLGVPDGQGNIAFIIDQSASVVAKSELLKRQRASQSIPDGWALDSDGQPTTDPDAGLKGSMLPAGGYKGFGIGLMVEIFAAALTAAHLGIDASPFAGDQGGPPKTGQFFIAINPQLSANNMFAQQITALCDAIQQQDGARLPGEKKLHHRMKHQEKGVWIKDSLLV